MADENWVSIGEYDNLESAQVVAGRLSVEGVENQVVTSGPAGGLFGAIGEYSILVPPESVEAARQILSEPPIGDAELTALALQDPPPDDFDTSATPANDEDPHTRGSS